MALANSKDLELRERALKVIPGGMYGHQSTILLPEGYPQFFSRAEGARLWDADGNSYIDYMCAYGPNLFGYCHAEIDDAAIAQTRRGDVMTGPSPLIVELAEKFVGMVGHADWAIFCKNGTDATTMALTIARAHTGKRKVLTAKGAYHGAAPWCTPRPAGIIAEDRAHQIHFIYNDIASLESAVKQAGDDLAAIFAAPFKHDAFQDQQLPARDNDKSFPVSTVDLATGKSTPWKQLRPAQPVLEIHDLHIAPGGAYAYTYVLANSDLYIARGLR